MIKVIIYGPTAVGKTSLSLSLAKKLNAEIISADSMQVYKYMNIGTAKIKDNQKEGITHHLIDILEPNEKFNVSMFVENVENILKDLKNRGKNAIIVGGTALYIRALLNGLSEAPSSDLKIREELMKKDKEELHKELLKIDPEALEKIPLNNKIRLARALEVYYISGKKFSSYNQDYSKKIKNDFYKYFIFLDRETLYERINERVNLMIKEGLIEEAKFLYNKYGEIEAIGYKELFSYFKNETSLEFSINEIKKHSRNYAKRQLTWLNNMKDFKLINVEKEDPLSYILEDIKNKMEE